MYVCKNKYEISNKKNSRSMNSVYILLIMTVTYYKLMHASDETKQFYIVSTDNIERRISTHKLSTTCRKPN